jgi:hypothetical protein
MVRRRIVDAREDVLGLLYRLSAACHVDLNFAYRNTILVTSSGRSGSTWLAEVVNYRNEYRMIFEPFRRDRSPVAKEIPFGLYLDPAVTSPPEAAAIEAILRGRVRTSYSEQRNRRIARRRIVKDIRTTNLVPWIRARFPALPIVYLVRNPFAVARSWTRLGWRDFTEEFTRQRLLMKRFEQLRPLIDETVERGSAFDRHVLRWCLENHIPLHDLAGDELHVVFYEDLLRDPISEVSRLFAYLGKPFEPRALERLSEPSATAFAESAAQPVEHDTARATEIIAAFDLDRLYGADENPAAGTLRAR